MRESTLEAVVENLLTAYGVEFSRGAPASSGKSTFRPDFITRSRGLRTAVEVRPAGVDPRGLYVAFAWYDDARYRRAIDRLLVVTPESIPKLPPQRFRPLPERVAAPSGPRFHPLTSTKTQDT